MRIRFYCDIGGDSAPNQALTATTRPAAGVDPEGMRLAFDVELPVDLIPVAGAAHAVLRAVHVP